MRNLLLIVTLSILVTAAFGKNAFDYDDPPVHLFKYTKSAQVAKIGHAESQFGKFQGYEIATPWLMLNQIAASRLGSLLEKRIEEEAALYAREKGDVLISMPLCFEPGYAIHLETDKGSRDFVICLHCSYIFIYDALGHKLGLNPEGNFYDALVASYKEEFGDEKLSTKHPNQSKDPTP